MEENKLIESKKILTDYMLELNRDIQSAEEWANTSADEEMYWAIKNVLEYMEKITKENEELKKYISLAPNLDEMTAAKYINIQQNAYMQGRVEEQKKYFDLINRIKNRMAKFDYEYKKSKRKNDEDRADYYWDLFRHFKKNIRR